VLLAGDRQAGRDRTDVYHHARSSFDHAGDEGAVEPRRPQQVKVNDRLPVGVGQRFETVGLGFHAAGVADEDVEPAPVGWQPTGNGLDARGGSDVGRDEQDAVQGVRGRRPRGCDDAGASKLEAADDRPADAACAAGHQHALVRELIRRCGEGVGLGHTQASALLWMMINWVIRSSRRLK
jgi:hypothetical protein